MTAKGGLVSLLKNTVDTSTAIGNMRKLGGTESDLMKAKGSLASLCRSDQKMGVAMENIKRLGWTNGDLLLANNSLVSMLGSLKKTDDAITNIAKLKCRLDDMRDVLLTCPKANSFVSMLTSITKTNTAIASIATMGGGVNDLMARKNQDYFISMLVSSDAMSTAIDNVTKLGGTAAYLLTAAGSMVKMLKSAVKTNDAIAKVQQKPGGKAGDLLKRNQMASTYTKNKTKASKAGGKIAAPAPVGVVGEESKTRPKKG
jgi:hypothetical protein